MSNEYKIDSKKNVLTNENNTIELKLDWRYNYLTSSSTLSACFFALLLEDQEKFKKFLKWLFENYYNNTGFSNAEINDISVKTEYIDKRIYGGDGSHIDALISFYANEEQYNIFVEIKYCEDKYGVKTNLSEVGEKLKKQHQDFLELKNIDADYPKYFQIIRNLYQLRNAANDYCLFLLPKANESAYNEIKCGIKELASEKMALANRIAVVDFAKAVKEMFGENSDLYQKYFA